MDCFFGIRTGKTKGKQDCLSWCGIGRDFARSFASSDTLETFGKGTFVDPRIATNDYDS